VFEGKLLEIKDAEWLKQVSLSIHDPAEGINPAQRSHTELSNICEDNELPAPTAAESSNNITDDDGDEREVTSLQDLFFAFINESKYFFEKKVGPSKRLLAWLCG
jgi:hypothetical protein